MRKIILNVAVSLDGYLEGPNGEYDWCFSDQDYGMKNFMQEVDTIFFGRRSYHMLAEMDMDYYPNQKKYVFSSTLTADPPGATLVSGDVRSAVEKIRKEPGKNIWLFGGAALVKTFLQADLIDEARLAVHPVVLGSGKPLFQHLSDRLILHLIESKTYSSGLVQLFYRFK